MNTYERKILTILFLTNKTLYRALKSNQYRLNSITQLNDEYKNTINNVSIVPLEKPLQKIRDEIYNCLLFSREYIDFLSKKPSINIYDAAEIIVEIGDISRFKNIKYFISYAGLAPILKNGNNFSKITKYGKGKIVSNKKYDSINYCENLKTVLTRCTQKMIHSNTKYTYYYNDNLSNYQYKHPKYENNRLHLMALKKTTISFAKEVYNEFKYIKELELYEQKKYNDGE